MEETNISSNGAVALGEEKAAVPLPSTEPQISIEIEDLRELARINPLAWEQLMHITDNRRNAERIAELESRLAT